MSQNNQREVLIEVLDRTEKLLYYEGEPRPEMKFLRRAVEDDKNLEVVTLQRTADNKFMRLSVDGPEELEKTIVALEEEMLAAADDLRFEEAGRIRDELKELRRDLDGMTAGA